MKNQDRVIQLKQAGMRNFRVAAQLNLSKQYVSRVWRTHLDGGPRVRDASTSVFITSGEASRLSGLSISTVRRLCDVGKLGAFRVPGRRKDRRIRTSDLRQWMAHEFLTVGDASRLLGVGVTTVTRWCDIGKLPSVRLGGTRRDRRVALADAQRVQRLSSSSRRDSTK